MSSTFYRIYFITYFLVKKSLLLNQDFCMQYLNYYLCERAENKFKDPYLQKDT